MSEECVVKDCTNRTNQGGFVGEICTPCYEFITEGTGKFSQAYRNAQKEWQGLSDEEIWDIANFLGKNKEWDYPVMFAKTIEQALKEKNT